MLLKIWNTLTPRWKGVVLTLQAELQNDPWIDIKFTPSEEVSSCSIFRTHGIQVYTEHMDYKQMSRYKYQFDIGGGGGTSWRGTTSKLGMP